MKNTVNILFGPPDREKERIVLSFFFSLPGPRIVSGGTTSNLVSRYLDKPLEVDPVYLRPDVPPVGKTEGVDLVTEGVVTWTRVKEMLLSGEEPGEDAASLITKYLLGADEINFVCGILSDEKKEILAFIVPLLQTKGKKVNLF